MDEGVVLLLVGAVLAASVLGALASARTGVPVLVAFLAFGMLLGLGRPRRHRLRRRRARPRGRHHRPRPDPLRGRPADVLAAAAGDRGARGAPEHGRSRRDRRAHRSRGAGAVRPDLARSHPARRRRRVHRCRGGVRNAPLHADQAAARANARSRVGRQRPDGDRPDDRPDRLDREPGHGGLRPARPARDPPDRPRPRRRAPAGRGSDLGVRAAATRTSARSLLSHPSPRPASRSALPT